MSPEANSISPAAPSHVPDHLLRSFSYQMDDALKQDPWTTISRLSDGPPIFFTTDLGGYWVLSRQALIEEVMTKPEQFSSKNATIPRLVSAERMIPPHLDAPEHGKYRKIISQRIFSPRALAGVEADARAVTRSLIDRVVGIGEGDFLADFARPLPITIFMNLMGMPIGRLPEFITWIETFFHGDDPKLIQDARQNLHDFALEWIQSTSEGCDSRILAELKTSEIDGRRLTEDELASIVMTLFAAGLDTVTAQIAHIIHFLAAHPAQRELLVNSPDRIPAAIEEMLRRFGIANLGRRVVADMEFHGVSLRADDLILLSTVIAGMDRQARPDAAAVDFDRPDVRRHLAFGAGPHLCVGAFLARTEIRVLLEEVLSRLPNLRLKAGAAVRYSPGKVMTVEALLVQWDTDG